MMRSDIVMILYSQSHAVLGGLLSGQFQSLDYHSVLFIERQAGALVAGEDSHNIGAEIGGKFGQLAIIVRSSLPGSRSLSRRVVP